MAQPRRHPVTGIYQFRRAVPRDLRAVLGKSEELKTLETRDPDEARVRFAKYAAEVEARWATLRAGPRSLTEREASEMAADAYNDLLNAYADDPSYHVLVWNTALYEDLWAINVDARKIVDGQVCEFLEVHQAKSMQVRCRQYADAALDRRGMRVDEFSLFKLIRAMAAAFQRASLDLQAAADRNVASPIFAADRQIARDFAKEGAPAITLTGIFEGWWKEAAAAGRKPSTHESYRNTIKILERFLGHDDATRLTPEDIIAFKDHRLSTPSPRTGKTPSPKTVRDSDLAALNALFKWATTNRKLKSNPAAGVTLKVGSRPRLRPKGFTDEEAVAILTAALRSARGERELPQTASARRWIPWLCAFTGARVGEIAQLRKQDIRRVGDLWVLRITPEAGTVKTNEAREVPLHPQLAELGFQRFVAASANGPLFLVPDKAGKVLGPMDGLKNRMREFVRSIVPDPNVQPNHGWRHRFSTICIDAGIEHRVYNAIQGHAGSTVAERYGDVTLKAKAAAICRLTHIDVRSTDSSTLIEP